MLPAQIWWQDPMKLSCVFLFSTQHRKNKEKNKQTKLYLYYLSYTIICRVARKIFAQFDKWNCRVHYSWEIKEMFVGKCPCKQIMLQQLISFLQRGQWKTYQHKKSCPGQSWSWSALVSNVRSSTSLYYISLWSGFRNIDDPKTERLSDWATHQVISNQYSLGQLRTLKPKYCWIGWLL